MPGKIIMTGPRSLKSKVPFFFFFLKPDIGTKYNWFMVRSDHWQKLFLIIPILSYPCGNCECSIQLLPNPFSRLSPITPCKSLELKTRWSKPHISTKFLKCFILLCLHGWPPIFSFVSRISLKSPKHNHVSFTPLVLNSCHFVLFYKPHSDLHMHKIISTSQMGKR